MNMILIDNKIISRYSNVNIFLTRPIMSKLARKDEDYTTIKNLRHVTIPRIGREQLIRLALLRRGVVNPKLCTELCGLVRTLEESGDDRQGLEMRILHAIHTTINPSKLGILQVLFHYKILVM